MRQHIPYEKAVRLLEEGDILLFRGKGFISWLIAWAGRGEYSHVGMASRNYYFDGQFDIVEIREGAGGRVQPLHKQVVLYAGRIDVYRPSPKVIKLVFDGEKVIQIESVYNPMEATNILRALVGDSYGWRRIWWLAKYHIFGYRLFVTVNTDDNSKTTSTVNPVCSTAVSFAVGEGGLDLVPNLAHDEVVPSDIARSAVLNYLFTLDPFSAEYVQRMKEFSGMIS